MSSFGSILTAALVLCLGFVLLIKGADAFVDGSSAVARRLRIPGLVIGLTIVAMGTSLPELAVSVTAALAGSNEIAVSNVTGSNIFNLMIVLGFSALFTPLAVSRKSLTREFPFSVACAARLAVFGATGAAANEGGAIGLISRTEGLIFLFFFVLFLLYTLHEASEARRASLKDEKEDLMSLGKSLVLIVIGMLAIKFGGDFVVGGDTVIAGHELSYGAVALARQGGALRKWDFEPDAARRQANYARLQAVAARVLREVPLARLAQDSAGRETDIAIDHGEFTHLPPAAIEQAAALMRAEGLTATVSSIHINGWIGGHDKLAGAHWIVQLLLGRRLADEMAHWVYVGDSTNDQRMFQHFPNSVGVANVARFAPHMEHLPRYVAQGERGAGFAQAAQAVLQGRG